MSGQSLRIGTRKSAMALARTEEIARRLRGESPDLAVAIIKFETPGDQDQTSRLACHGGSRGKGFSIGTNAVRRTDYPRRLFPEANIIHYRGAADTRMRKLDACEEQRLADGREVGPADALVMARSGLQRIGLASRIAYDFSLDEMLPAAGQGIVAVECAQRDWAMRRRLDRIDDAESRARAEAEREVLWILNRHCNSPIAAHATLSGHDMMLSASVLDEQSGQLIETSRRGPADRPRELGRAVGFALLDKGAAELIARCRPED